MRYLLSLFFIGLLLSPPTVAHAQLAGDCRERVNLELARELRLYRSVLFGKPLAEDADTNSVRFDAEGNAWLKKDNSDTPWVSVAPGFQDTTWSNSLMDGQDEHSEVIPLKGLLETERVSTSDLIPFLLQSIRALDCRSAAVCNVVQESQRKSKDDGPQTIDTIQPPGCKEFTSQQTFTECHFGAGDSTEASRVTDQADATTYCTSISNQQLQREAALLKLAVEYDASYRTMLQFAGNFDIFIRELRWPLATTIRQAAQMLGQLQRIPCFLASCDNFPPAPQE